MQKISFINILLLFFFLLTFVRCGMEEIALANDKNADDYIEKFKEERIELRTDIMKLR